MNYVHLYVSFLRKHFNGKKKLKVVFDSSDGATGIVLRELFKKNINVDARVIHGKPDGNFPAHGPDPLERGAMDKLKETVQRAQADCGIIFDADGDRVFFVDNKGVALSPEHAAILIGKNYNGKMILDLRMGYLAREWCREERREIVNSRIGHFFIKKLMRQKKIVYGAELSGHYYFKDFFYADSGIFAAIQFLNSVSRLNGSLHEWISTVPNYYQSGEVNFRIANANSVNGARMPRIDAKKRIMKRIEDKYGRRAKKISKLDGIKMEFGKGKGAWWFLVRPSNTEDKLRLVLEARDKNVFQSKFKEIKADIKRG